MEGMALAKTIVQGQPTKPDYEAVPSAVFSHPQMATVVRCRTPIPRICWRTMQPTSAILHVDWQQLPLGVPLGVAAATSCPFPDVSTHMPWAVQGLTEEQAVAQYGDVDIYTSSFRPMRNTISGSPMRSFMKLVVAAGSQVVVGCHMVGDDSAEIMQVRAGLTSACNVAARGRGGGVLALARCWPLIMAPSQHCGVCWALEYA